MTKIIFTDEYRNAKNIMGTNWLLESILDKIEKDYPSYGTHFIGWMKDKAIAERLRRRLGNAQKVDIPTHDGTLTGESFIGHYYYGNDETFRINVADRNTVFQICQESMSNDDFVKMLKKSFDTGHLGNYHLLDDTDDLYFMVENYYPCEEELDEFDIPEEV